jgi:hypothetical protein
MISTVHVVFKTHLDVGFTDLAASVVDRYLHAYLPRAIDLAGELEARGGAARFVWTTGSWLIQLALDSASADERARLEHAIAAGAIRWHGLPLTTHSEVMDAGLAAHGVSIARRLDARFGLRTIAAKMTDVPGHTIGLVPILARAGIRFLHIGVNGASAVPEVPEFFRWRSPDGSEVVVNYARSYGADELGVAVGPDGRTALHLAHTGDNFGPPSADDVEHLFADLARAYPGARIVASTLDAFAADVLAASDRLPVVEDEIGDSWIHGVGADPLLTAGLRNLLTLRTRWVESGELDPGSPEAIAFSDALLLVAEHTWGEDLKTFLPDYVNYSKPGFRAARARDVIDPTRNPPQTAAYSWAYEEHPGRTLTYSGFERSWQEQRTYLQRAVEALAPARAAEALSALRRLQAVHDAPAAGRVIVPGQEFDAGRFRIRLGEDGSLAALVDESGRDWAGDEHRLAAYRYQTFDERDEHAWLEQYCRDLDRNGFWAVPDQSKPGLAIAGTHPATVFVPRVVRAMVRTDGDDDVVSVSLALPDAATDGWGAPRDLRLEYAFPRGAGAIQVQLTAAGRDASRLPEASWLGFRPRPVDRGEWRLDKLGTLVDPTRVVHAGNRSLHAVHGIERAGEAPFRLATLDAPLVAVGEPRLLRFENRVATPDDGFHVNLHNNVWGTNFRMWFDDDLRYRFELVIG